MSRNPKPSKSTLFFKNGKHTVMDSQLAYAMWLGIKGTALRIAGDTRPVQSWDYNVK